MTDEFENEDLDVMAALDDGGTIEIPAGCGKKVVKELTTYNDGKASEQAAN